MKPILLSFLVCLVSSSAFATETDPRVLAVLRKEQSTAQSFCFSFAHDGVRNGLSVAQACTSFAGARYAGNYSVANKTKDLAPVGLSISRYHAEFCASVGEYSKPGTWVRGDCDAWNRARGELFTLGSTEGTPTATLSAKIEKVESYRKRFCQSLLQGGNPGDAQIFGSRISNCFTISKLATAADRAIFLGDF